MASETNAPTAYADGTYPTASKFTNPTNVFTNNTLYMVCTDTSSLHDGDFSSFGFSIPSGATIDGILFGIRALDTFTDGSYSSSVQVSKDGGSSYVGDEKTIISGTNFGSVSDFTVGGASDLWNTTWSDTDFANGSFEVRFKITADSYPDEIRVEYMWVTVYYTESGGVNDIIEVPMGPLR